MEENKMEKLNTIYKLLKIDHYIKNLVIFLPVVYLGNIFSNEAIETLKVFVTFCLMSSAVYIFNDIKDLEKDKTHPIKSLRPLAQGKISVNKAAIILVILLCLAIFAGFHIVKASNLCILVYFILNIFYSTILKKIKFVDMACISVGFILRLMAGFYAVALPVSFSSALMVLCTSMFFTSSKRILEYNLLSQMSERRLSMQGVDIKILHNIMLTNLILAIAGYGLWCYESFSGKISLILTTIPYILFMLRLCYLVSKKQNHDDPMNFIEKDKVIWLLFSIYFLLLFVAIIP